jgi:hypothetical protein
MVCFLCIIVNTVHKIDNKYNNNNNNNNIGNNTTQQQNNRTISKSDILKTAKIFSCDAVHTCSKATQDTQTADEGRKFSQTLSHIFQISRSHLAEDSNFRFISVLLFLCNLDTDILEVKIRKWKNAKEKKKPVQKITKKHLKDFHCFP